MNNAIFVHFLNREMLRSLNLENITEVNQAIKVLLIATDLKLYVPLSSICENMGTSDLDYDFIFFVYEMGQIDIISSSATWEEFLDRNAKMYYFDQSRYSCYFEKNNKKFEKFIPTVVKKIEVTGSIKDFIIKWEKGERLPIQLTKKDKKILIFNKKKIFEINRASEGKAITKSLFTNQLYNSTHELTLARLLSICYIQEYQRDLQADIATGVNRYISFFDTLAIDFPYNDIPILIIILEYAGLKRHLLMNENSRDWYVFLNNRCDSQHERICNYIINIIKLCIEFNRGSIETSLLVLRNKVKKVLTRVLAFYDSIIELPSINHLNLLEENLLKIYNLLSEKNTGKYDPCSDKMQLAKGDESSMKKAKIFISHSSEDAETVLRFVDLLADMGFTNEDLFCSSVPDYGIPLNMDIFDYLASLFSDYDVYVIFMLSQNYYNSPVCLNEMGAAWVLKSDYTSILLPSFSYLEIKGAVNPHKIGFRYDDENELLKKRLGELIHILAERTGKSIPEMRWEKKRNGFVNDIKLIKITQGSTTSNNSIEYSENLELNSITKENEPPIPDIDKLVAKIDQRIAELELEEKKKNNKSDETMSNLSKEETTEIIGGLTNIPIEYLEDDKGELTRFDIYDAKQKKMISTDVLFTFEEETGEKYVVYTDNTRDEKGNICLYPGVLKKKGNKVQVVLVKDEKELKRIEVILDELQKEVRKNVDKKA